MSKICGSGLKWAPRSKIGRACLLRGNKRRCAAMSNPAQPDLSRTWPREPLCPACSLFTPFLLLMDESRSATHTHRSSTSERQSTCSSPLKSLGAPGKKWRPSHGPSNKTPTARYSTFLAGKQPSSCTGSEREGGMVQGPANQNQSNKSGGPLKLARA